MRWRAACRAGLYRSMWPTPPTSPRAANRSQSSRDSSAVEATGFSMSACTPASASCWPISTWYIVGAATTA